MCTDAVKFNRGFQIQTHRGQVIVIQRALQRLQLGGAEFADILNTVGQQGAALESSELHSKLRPSRWPGRKTGAGAPRPMLGTSCSVLFLSSMLAFVVAIPSSSNSFRAAI
jgi:hypothetical protein